MGRSPRITESGVAYHLLNRRVMRLTIFEKDEDYAAFERVLGDLAASRQTSQAAGKIILTPFLFSVHMDTTIMDQDVRIDQLGTRYTVYGRMWPFNHDVMHRY